MQEPIKVRMMKTIARMDEYTYEDVVGFDICMHDVTFPQKAQREEELLRVRAYGPNIQSHVFAKAFHDVTKVHTVCAANVSAASKQ